MSSIFDRIRVGRREVRGAFRGTRPAVDPGTRVGVLGGGLAGTAAACVLAERGAEVVLLEKERFLGGRAAAWTEYLPDGMPYQMERGFHAFFRHYYNVRALLARVDPGLSHLRPLLDYPILGPEGAIASFADLPRTPPLNLISLLRRTPFLSFGELREVDRDRARAMLDFHPRRTYATWDDKSARDYLESLRFPATARRMLFEVFAHSFFNPEEGMSAAELLMMFHFYFLGNPEGLVFDVLEEPFSDALWKPMERHLEELRVELMLGEPATAVRFGENGRGYRVERRGGAPVDVDALVLALSVPALRELVERSPDLHVDAGFLRSIRELDVTLPFAVWRLFFDRPVAPERAPFVGTAGYPGLDNISVYERFEGESRRWAMRTGGSVVELHAYAVRETDQQAIKERLLAGLHDLYPETRAAEIRHASWLFRQDCPSFAPGSHKRRPRVSTPFGNLALAGDFVKLPFPTALMERAVASGFLAANTLLDRWDVRGEPLSSIPAHGLMASVRG